jgi:hypothetical protein
MELTLTPELLASVAGTIISLGFSYIPGLSTKFAALSAVVKSAIMAGLMVVVSVVIFVAGCNGLIVTGLECTTGGGWKLVSVILAAIIANQAAYQLSPQTRAVEAAKGYLPPEQPSY